MATIQIFDPVQYQHPGMSTNQVEQLMADLAADIDWIAESGARVERFNHGQQPQAFADNPTVKALLDRDGADALPVILVDGEVALSGRYPSRTELVTWSGSKKLVVLQSNPSDCCSGGQCG